MAESLSEHTTLRVGGEAAEFVVADTEQDLVEAVRSADAAEIPVLLLGGGSNLLVPDEGFDGRVVAVRTAGVQPDADACGGAVVRVAAGESWDALVERSVAEGWVGIEALSGIPGLVGATPVQNVGAYGQEVAGTVASLRCWDRQAKTIRTLFNNDCHFGYRTSQLKLERGRYVVLEAVFQFRLGDLGLPVTYEELAAALGVEKGDRVPATVVRDTVLELRRGKGMVLDPADHDTWSAGSFFTNPIREASAIPEGAPRWLQPDGAVKTSAAWLIEGAGFRKGHGNERAALSGKHVLALTNRGTATAADLLALAQEVRDSVSAKFGITLENEPVVVSPGR